jgi:hypothetical protein
VEPLVSVADQVAASVVEALENKVASLSDWWDSIKNVAVPSTPSADNSSQTESDSIKVPQRVVSSSSSTVTKTIEAAEMSEQQKHGGMVSLSADAAAPPPPPVLMKQRVVADRTVNSYHEAFSRAFHMNEGLLDEDRVVKAVMVISKVKVRAYLGIEPLLLVGSKQHICKFYSNY